MVGLLLTVVPGLTSCANDDNAVEPDPAQPVVEQAVGQWLKAVPGVSDVAVLTGKTGTGDTGSFYYFYFDQLIDHNHPEKGTFKQKAVLRYVGPEAPTVLHTQGYETTDTLAYLTVPSLVHLLNANFIELEYRYFGDSQPQPLDNIDFTYLDSEQASDDLHALVTAMKATGRFPGKWISSGVSKNGYTTALYAYYSSKKGYDDIDLYVPVAAPFNEELTDKRLSVYMMEKSTAFDPKSAEKLKAFGRAICSDTPLAKYLIKCFRSEYAEELAGLKGTGMSEEQIDLYALSNYIIMYQYFLQRKLMYFPVRQWTDLIPDTTGQTQVEFAEQFIKMDEKAFSDYLKKQNGTVTRAPYTEEQLIEMRKKDVTFAFQIQVAKEIGTLAYVFDFMKGCPYFSQQFVDAIVKENYLPTGSLPAYASQYSNALVLDFLNNFLPTTKMKMVFVYGEQDPITGSAIPDPTNPNVKKITVPKGCHNDYFDNPTYCPAETYNAIMRAVREAIE